MKDNIHVNFVHILQIIHVQYYIIVKIIIMKRFQYMNVNIVNMHLNIVEKLNDIHY
jgi:hypothetical protein